MIAAGVELGAPLAVRLSDQDTELAGFAAALPVREVPEGYVLCQVLVMRLVGEAASCIL